MDYIGGGDIRIVCVRCCDVCIVMVDNILFTMKYFGTLGRRRTFVVVVLQAGNAIATIWARFSGERWIWGRTKWRHTVRVIGGSSSGESCAPDSPERTSSRLLSTRGKFSLRALYLAPDLYANSRNGAPSAH